MLVSSTAADSPSSHPRATGFCFGTCWYILGVLFDFGIMAAEESSGGGDGASGRNAGGPYSCPSCGWIAKNMSDKCGECAKEEHVERMCTEEWENGRGFICLVCRSWGGWAKKCVVCPEKSGNVYAYSPFYEPGGGRGVEELFSLPTDRGGPYSCPRCGKIGHYEQSCTDCGDGNVCDSDWKNGKAFRCKGCGSYNFEGFECGECEGGKVCHSSPFDSPLQRIFDGETADV